MPKTAWALAVGSWSIACWLAAHDGLVLVLDPAAPGGKRCINGLSLYLGFHDTNDAVAMLGLVSMMLSLALPLVAATGFAVWGVRRWRARSCF